jgi:hypothetical protein
MAIERIQVLRGLEASLPAANMLQGELYYAVDTKKLWIGNGDGTCSPADSVLAALVSSLSQSLSSKAPLASPTFTGSVTVPAPTLNNHAATKKYVDDNGSPSSGWKAISETWTYLSANSVTVPSGAASRYQKGDYIMIGQSTTKYFVVTAVSDTVLSLTGGSDYVVDNAVITAAYLSRQANPFGFPAEFNYNPTSGGFSVAPSGVIARFSIKGGVCSVSIRQSNNGTSNSSGFSVTLPVQAANVAGAQWTAPAMIVDNGAVPTTPGLAVINAGAGSIALYINYAGTAFTATGGKRVAAVVMSYSI